MSVIFFTDCSLWPSDFPELAKVGFELILVLVIAHWYKQPQNNKCFKIKHYNPLNFSDSYLKGYTFPRRDFLWELWNFKPKKGDGVRWSVWVCAHTCAGVGCRSTYGAQTIHHFASRGQCIVQHKELQTDSSFAQFRRHVLSTLQSKLISKIASVQLFASQTKIFLPWLLNVYSMYNSNLIAYFSHS